MAGASIVQQTSKFKTRLISPTSTWKIDLTDKINRNAEMHMTQSNDVLWGKGTIATDNGVQAATATGSFSGNRINLDILTEDLTLFRLYLTMNGKSLSGDYHGYSTEYEPWIGIAIVKIN